MGFTDFVNDAAFSGKLRSNETFLEPHQLTAKQPLTAGYELEAISLGMSIHVPYFSPHFSLMRNNWSVFKRRLKTPPHDYVQSIQCTSDFLIQPCHAYDLQMIP